MATGRPTSVGAPRFGAPLKVRVSGSVITDNISSGQSISQLVSPASDSISAKLTTSSSKSDDEEDMPSRRPKRPPSPIIQEVVVEKSPQSKGDRVSRGANRVPAVVRCASKRTSKSTMFNDPRSSKRGHLSITLTKFKIRLELLDLIARMAKQIKEIKTKRFSENKLKMEDRGERKKQRDSPKAEKRKLKLTSGTQNVSDGQSEWIPRHTVTTAKRARIPCHGEE